MKRQVTLSFLGTAALLLSSALNASAQVPPANPPAANPPATQVETAVAVASPEPAAEKSDTKLKYKIGQGDVLIIRVFGHQELTREMPVTGSGNIRLPFFGEIQAACLTEEELSISISEKLKKYLKDPQVDVVVKEYRSQPVAVIGAVSQPGRFQMQRRIRLLELLTFAGGPSLNAGSTVLVIHNSEFTSCDMPVQPETTAPSILAQANELFSSFSIKDLLAGEPNANPIVKPGDIVSIPNADQVYVTGGVMRPGTVPLKGVLTVFTAISMAGGLNPEANKKNVQIIRVDKESGTRKEMLVNVEDIEKRKAEDILLMPNDVINIQESMAKNLRKSFMQIVPATVSAMPLIILP